MSLPIILNRPQLLVTPGNPPSGIVPVGETSLMFGQVNMKYETCDKVAVNDWVLFDQTQAKEVMFGSTRYFIVDEALYLFSEPPAP